MAVLRVWTERNEPAPTKGWHDCVYCAYLQALEAAGLARLAGVDRVTEREALERSQTIYKPETGSSLSAGAVAVKERYQLTPHKALSLGPLLDMPGLAIVAAGVNSRLPTRLHRWDPAYLGSHAVTFVTLLGGGVLILDPEATDKYAGEPITKAEALAWWDRTAVYYWAVGELEGSMRTVFTTVWPQQRKWHLAAGATLRAYSLGNSSPQRVVNQPADRSTWAHADAQVVVQGPMTGAIPEGTYLRVSDGFLDGWYIPSSQVKLDPAPPDPVRDAATAALRTLQEALA
jgi:hypothetical protein